MIHNKFYSGLFALLGFLLLASAAIVSVTSRTASSRMILISEDAVAVTAEFMDSLSEGDWDGSAALLLGQPRLKTDAQHTNPLSELLWDAFTGSITYAFQSELSPSGSGCRREVCVTALDVSAVMAKLEETAPALLSQAASGTSGALDENSHYQESFVMDVLCQGAQVLLKQPEFTVSRTISLELVSQDGRWWVLPQDALMDLLCGTIPPQA